MKVSLQKSSIISETAQYERLRPEKEALLKYVYNWKTIIISLLTICVTETNFHRLGCRHIKKDATAQTTSFDAKPNWGPVERVPMTSVGCHEEILSHSLF